VSIGSAAWYMGTRDGLFLVERSPVGQISSRLLGLQHTGGFRAPVVVDCADPQRLFAGTTRAGLFRSDDGGATWREINRGMLYKDIWALAQQPTKGVLYAGTSPAGVFRSDDRGETWTACESLWQLPSTREWRGPVPPYISRLKDLTVSDADPQLVIGAIEEGWVIRTEDGGASWQQIAQGLPHDTHTVRFVPGAATTLVLGTNDGMYRSTDSGCTWSAVNDGLDGRRYTPAPLVTRASRPGVLFTSIAAVGPGGWQRPEGGDAAFCRSDDGGQSWKTLCSGLPRPLAAIPRAVAVDPANPRGYLAGLTDGSLWATDDDGESFRQMLAGQAQAAVMALTPATA
jgi:photosystem II stability/assembly factor-like uncharacterized protein